MPAEPDGHDLQRQLDRLRDELQKALDRAENHVTDGALQSLMARVVDQIQAVAEDIAQERGMRAVDIEGLRRQLDTELKRLEKDAEKTERARADEAKERRADSRVIKAAALAAAVSLVLWVLDKLPGGAP